MSQAEAEQGEAAAEADFFLTAARGVLTSILLFCVSPRRRKLVRESGVLQLVVSLLRASGGASAVPPESHTSALLSASARLPPAVRGLCISCYATLHAASRAYPPAAVDLCRHASLFVQHVGRGVGAAELLAAILSASPRALAAVGAPGALARQLLATLRPGGGGRRPVVLALLAALCGSNGAAEEATVPLGAATGAGTGTGTGTGTGAGTGAGTGTGTTVPSAAVGDAAGGDRGGAGVGGDAGGSSGGGGGFWLPSHQAAVAAAVREHAGGDVLVHLCFEDVLRSADAYGINPVCVRWSHEGGGMRVRPPLRRAAGGARAGRLCWRRVVCSAVCSSAIWRHHAASSRGRLAVACARSRSRCGGARGGGASG